MTASTAHIDDDQLGPLTVKGLIEELGKFPADALVVVDGYEGGLDSLHVEGPSLVSIRHQREHADWEGEYEDAEWNPSQNDIAAVRLPRKHR